MTPFDQKQISASVLQDLGWQYPDGLANAGFKNGYTIYNHGKWYLQKGSEIIGMLQWDKTIHDLLTLIEEYENYQSRDLGK